MSRRNYVEDLEYGAAFGMDTTSPLASMKPGYVRDAQNTDLGLFGGYAKRGGYVSQLTNAWGTRNIIGGIEYKNKAGTVQKILFGQDNTDGRFGYINSGSVTNIATGLSNTTRPSFVQFGDLLMFFNGVDSPIVYDGTNTYQCGITPPVTAPSISSQTTGGNLTQTGTYIWFYTYYNSATGAESSPSPASASTTLTGTNSKVNLGLAAGSSSTADTIRIWRTVANGNAAFLEGTTGISSTTYVSSASDASLTTAMELDNTQISTLSATAKYPMVVQNRVFLCTNTNEIRYSKIGQSGPMPQSFQAKAVVTTIGNNGSNDPIVGIASCQQVPIVLKRGSIGYLNQVGVQNTTDPTDPVAYVYSEITNAVGALSHWAAVECLNELVFIGHDNIYATDGQTVRPIADPIQSTISTLGFNSSQITKISAWNYKRKKQLLFAVYTSGSAATPAMVLVGDYKVLATSEITGITGKPSFRWTYYVQGPNTSTWPGIVAGCFFEVTNSTSGDFDVWFGNFSGNGKVYQLDSGNTDDGAAIYHKIVSRPYAGENHPLFHKLFGHAGVHAAGNGGGYNLTISAIYDLSGSEVNSLGISLANSGALWDNVVWDQFNWADTSVTPLDYWAHQNARYQQLVFYQTNANAPLAILGWGTSGSIYKPQ